MFLRNVLKKQAFTKTLNNFFYFHKRYVTKFTKKICTLLLSTSNMKKKIDFITFVKFLSSLVVLVKRQRAKDLRRISLSNLANLVVWIFCINEEPLDRFYYCEKAEQLHDESSHDKPGH